MQRPHVDHATPTAERAVTSYPARHLYKPGVVFPPAVNDVRDAIDLHAHCSAGQQDALALAKLASESGMLGIVFKTIAAKHGGYRPAADVAAVREDLARWADGKDLRPIHCWPGYLVGTGRKEPALDAVRAQLDAGVRAVWLPVSTHANSYFKVGIRETLIDPAGNPHGHTGPLPWEQALRYGLYMLDERGRLKPFYDELIRMVVDYDVALSFGHATHQEIEVVAALIGQLGYKRAVIDHPFSPFVDLTVEMMRELAPIGIRFNFTYDELSPLLGVDPFEMHAAIEAVGVEHCTLSSDAGEALLPNSVEALRLIRAYMAAFGSSDADLAMMCTANPSEIVGLPLAVV
jgi:hypothetical protein